ncbi:MAG: DUF2125 domain-containing protein [Pseudomonadota bacterium]
MTSSDRAPSRRLLYVPLIIVALIFAVYAGLWRFGATQMVTAVNQWVADQNAAGLTVTHDDIRSSGFPFFLRTVINSPVISSPEIGQWRGEKLVIEALPYDLNRLIFVPLGEQRVSHIEFGDWTIDAEGLRASIANDKTRGWAFAANVENAKAQSDAGDSASLGALIVDIAPQTEGLAVITMNLAAETIALQRNGIESQIDRFEGSFALTETLAFNTSRPLLAWRSAGGSLIIRGMAARLPEAEMSLQGEVSVDAQNFPVGELNAQFQNPAAFGRLLGDFGVIGRREAMAAEAGLNLAAMATGGKLTAPVRLEDGRAKIAGIAIAELPQLAGN